MDATAPQQGLESALSTTGVEGSMNGPTEALTRFWTTLREKSRDDLIHVISTDNQTYYQNSKTNN